LVDVPGRHDQVDPRLGRVGGVTDHRVPLRPPGVDHGDAPAEGRAGRRPGRRGVAALGQPELHGARRRVPGQRGQVGVPPGEQRVPGRQRDPVLQPHALPHGIDQPVHPRHAVPISAAQACEAQHGALDRNRRVRPGQLDNRLSGRSGQFTGFADDGRIESELRLHHASSLICALRCVRYTATTDCVVPVRPSKMARTAGSARIRPRAIWACPGTYPLPISMVTSAATPSAPSAAAVNEAAIEKKITVPPWAVASTAPPSQPGTSTQTTVTSAGRPAPATTENSASGSRASAITTWSASPLRRSTASSASVGTTPMTVRAPARPGAAAGGEPLLPAAPAVATTGPAALGGAGPAPASARRATSATTR